MQDYESDNDEKEFFSKDVLRLPSSCWVWNFIHLDKYGCDSTSFMAMELVAESSGSKVMRCQDNGGEGEWSGAHKHHVGWVGAVLAEEVEFKAGLSLW